MLAPWTLLSVIIMHLFKFGNGQVIFCTLYWECDYLLMMGSRLYPSWQKATLIDTFWWFKMLTSTIKCHDTSMSSYTVIVGNKFVIFMRHLFNLYIHALSVLFTFLVYDLSVDSRDPLTHLPWTKWPPFPRWHFQMHFYEWKVLCFDSNFIEVCF